MSGTFFLCEISAEGSGPNHGWAAIGVDLGTSRRCTWTSLVHGQIPSDSPLGTTNTLGSLVKLCSHVKVVNRTVIEDDQRVYLEVCKVEVDIDSVQPDEEIREDLFLVLGDISKEGILKVGTSRELAKDGYVEFKGLCIDISDINTTRCGEE